MKTNNTCYYCALRPGVLTLMNDTKICLFCSLREEVKGTILYDEPVDYSHPTDVDKATTLEKEECDI